MQTVAMAANPGVAAYYGGVMTESGPLVCTLRKWTGARCLSDTYSPSPMRSLRLNTKKMRWTVTVLKFPGLIAERSLGDEQSVSNTDYYCGTGKAVRTQNKMAGKRVIGMTTKGTLASWTTTQTVYNQGVCVWFASSKHMKQTFLALCSPRV